LIFFIIDVLIIVVSLSLVWVTECTTSLILSYILFYRSQIVASETPLEENI